MNILLLQRNLPFRDQGVSASGLACYKRYVAAVKQKRSPLARRDR
jgi:hypothetical protein